MTMKTRTQFMGLAAALVAVACADSTAPVRPINSAAPTLDVRPVQVVGMNKPTGTFYGEVWLCKEVSTGDPSTNSFGFTVTSTSEDGGTATAPTNAAPSFTDVAPGETFPDNCTRIYDAVSGISEVDRLVITETAQANWSVSDIIVQHYTFNPPAQDPFPATTFTASIDPANRTATVRGNSETIVVVTFINDYTPPPPPPTGNNGCTPGYWKQSHHFDSWPAAYTPGMDFDAVFGVNVFNPNRTLLQALSAGGGGWNALGRHAVAALLNAASGFYPLTTAQVISAVQAAAANSSLVESTHNNLAAKNELGCLLN